MNYFIGIKMKIIVVNLYCAHFSRVCFSRNSLFCTIWVRSFRKGHFEWDVEGEMNLRDRYSFLIGKSGAAYHGCAPSCWSAAPWLVCVSSQAIAPTSPNGSPSSACPAPGPSVPITVEDGCLLLFAGHPCHQSWRFGGSEKPVLVPAHFPRSQLILVGSSSFCSSCPFF